VFAPPPVDEPVFSVGPYSQVFVAKRHGGAHRLTGRPGGHIDAAWSPSGRRIAVVAYRRIEIRTVGGSVRRTIRARVYGPVTWAPGDRRLAFVAYRHGGARGDDLVVIDADDGHRHAAAYHAFGQPAWSPDGRTVFYVGRYRGRFNLYAVDARGGTARRLAKTVDGAIRVVASPRGDWVLFRRDETTHRAGVWIVRPDGSEERRVIPNDYTPTPYGWTIGDPPRSYGWTFGGRAVYGGKADDWHPEVRTLAGRRLSPGVRFSGGQYAMSLDGRRVAWIGGRYQAKLRMARSDDHGRRELARFDSPRTNAVDVASLAWSPDGRRLVIEAQAHFDGSR
jgi:Tol biopolymer transport system component